MRKIWTTPLLCAMVGLGSVASAQTAGPMRVTSEIETSTAEATAAVTMADFEKDRAEQKEFGDLGWSLSIGGNLGPWLAIVGEIDGYANYYTLPTRTRGIRVDAPVNHVHDFLAGPRVHSRFLRVGRAPYANDIRVFGQVLAGTRLSEAIAGGRTIQPGAGVDVHTRRGFTVRSELDYFIVSGSGGGLSGSRWLVGIVLGPS